MASACSGDPAGVQRTPASGRLRELARGELAARLPEHLARLRWNRARIETHQRDRLRALLACAAAHVRRRRHPVAPNHGRLSPPAAVN
jgi:hypothetical protein